MLVDGGNVSGRSGVAYAFGFAFLAATAWLGFGVVDFHMPDYGLDPSWQAVLGEALRTNLKFGSDIIYTGGPLSIVYSRYFVDHSFWIFFSTQVYLVISFAWLSTILTRAAGRPTTLIASSILLLFLGSIRDPLFMALPMLTALVTLAGTRDRAGLIGVLLGLSATAVVSLAKASIIPLALVAFLLADLERVAKRRAPLHVAIYALTVFGIFSLIQGPGAFWAYLVGSLNVSSGYTEAMFLIGSPVELVSFLASIALLMGIIVFAETSAVRARRSSIFRSTLRAGVIAAYLFMIWKAGFVREDLHTLIGWTGLALAALAYAAARPPSEPSGGLSILLLLGAASALLFAVPWIWSTYAHVSGLSYLERIGQAALRQAIDTTSLLTNPGRQIETWRAARKDAWAAIRRVQTLPHLDGSVDVIPSIQSSVLAYGLDYKPRTSIQEFTTYTRDLIEANRRSLVDRGPTYLLFQPGSIDGRHPASAEGPLWPDIMRLYEPDSQEGDLLVLRRRNRALGDILGARTELRTTFGNAVALPAGPSPLFLKAQIRKTLFGRLMDLVYRPSLIVLRVDYMDGSEQRYRVVPAIVQGGFFISPLVAHADDFLMIASGGDLTLLPKVKGITFETSAMGLRMFEPDIALEVRPLLSDALRSAPPISPTMRQLIDDRQRLALLRAAANGSHSVRVIPEGILAEAPTRIVVPVTTAGRRLTVSFGIAAGAYATANGTQGVCFRVDRQRAGVADIALLDRCLTPLAESHDRGEISAAVDADLKPGDRLGFQTACLKSCAYGWAYWSRFSLQP